MSSPMQTESMLPLPRLPTRPEGLISYLSDHPTMPLRDLIAPFQEHDFKLRQVFAQQPNHPAIQDSHVLPLFSGHEQQVKIRARDVAAEPEIERQRYLMPLTESDRKADGAPAVVPSLEEFRNHFQLFSESSLVDMDWSNVVAAGSAVVTSLLPVPPEHGSSKRSLRKYYHQILAPASDVDLFLYGLTEEQAVEKIKQIEQRIRDSILEETTTIRTKNAITIASRYPTRHVQIVLRIYRSVSEILTGFDVDCSCAAYDGNQVYLSPRALVAYMTQINTIDLTRRSPSYENRLSKYARRGFEVYWPLLDRSRIDPTLFERSFGRIHGLARLLVLEKLPKDTDREAYVDQRRAERGRPTLDRQRRHKLRGNIKDEHDDEVAEWAETEDVSDYHTFTIPYGPKYHARNIERLLYAKDLLLNAEWNRPKDRETALHRHPAFFGNAVDVIGDCCGYCPKPVSREDQELAEEESKIYVSGDIAFIKDNPGRQTIGSFHPLTDDDWTEMAYVGNTARLCQAIVDGDLEHVQDWLKQDDADPNRRDYTGRTPLHLAVASSTTEIVQCLIDAGARITARLFDGKTALHLAAMRGETEKVKAILTKSEANEEEEAIKEAKRTRSSKSFKEREMMNVNDAISESHTNEPEKRAKPYASEKEDDSIDLLDDKTEHIDATTENSIVKIDRKQNQEHDNDPEDESQDDPDVCDINVVAWDVPVTPLHLAIANGHTETVRTLVQDFGADVLLPIKLVNDYNKSSRAAIMPLVLALQLAKDKSKEMTTLLLSLGASPAQADIDHVTVLHYFAAYGPALLKLMISIDRPAAQRAVNHLSMSGHKYNPGSQSALQTAIIHKDMDSVEALLKLGAKAKLDYSAYITSYKSKWDSCRSEEYHTELFRHSFEQPVFTAIYSEMPSVVPGLLDAGAEVNTLCTQAQKALDQRYSYNNEGVHSLLDAVRERITELSDFITTGKVILSHYEYVSRLATEPIPLKDDKDYLQGVPFDTYVHWTTLHQLQQAKDDYERDLKSYQDSKVSQEEPAGTSEKKLAVKSLLAEFEALEKLLIERGAKPFTELYPDHKIVERSHSRYHYEPETPKPWAPNITFQIADLTEERREAYIKLFQACWDGDLSTVKELTLLVWGENQSQSPLKIAVKDTSNFSPFSLAVLRKHFDLAKAIAEIAHAQYAPVDQIGQTRHSVGPPEDEDSSESQDGFEIYTEIVDDRFTFEGIGVVQSQVKSSVTPLEMISWPCPAWCFLEHDVEDGPENLLQFAMYTNDEALLDFVITLGEDYTIRKACHQMDVDEPKPAMFRFNEADFHYAIGLGRIQLLQQIIRRTGAGIPLDELAKESGVETVVKPTYYQGLSVYGKKRADWADAGRQTRCDAQEEQHPPLLHAARLANLESVEWFLSDAASRCYLEFADEHDEDIRIRHLAKAKGGPGASIKKWLSLRSHLVLHCVVLRKTTKDTVDLLRHLCRAYPEMLQHRSAKGLTPLHLAFSLHRVEMIKVLLAAGADQTCRNHARDNIIHSILDTPFEAKKGEPEAAQLRNLLHLVDPRLLSSLFMERTTQSPGAATPLALWLYGRGEAAHHEAMLQVMLEFSQGEDLGIINAEGDTPLHMAVRYKADGLLRIMLECRPALLFRENATGRTPYEMAEDAFLSKEVFHDPPSLIPSSDPHGGRNPRYYSYRTVASVGLVAQAPHTFVEEGEAEARSKTKKVWHVCKEFADKTPGTKRKLVKLVEANEVANRLAVHKQSRSEDEAERENKAEEAEGGGCDEVDSWYWMGRIADN